MPSRGLRLNAWPLIDRLLGIPDANWLDGLALELSHASLCEACVVEPEGVVCRSLAHALFVSRKLPQSEKLDTSLGQLHFNAVSWMR